MDKIKVLDGSLGFLNKLDTVGVQNAAHIVNIYQSVMAVIKELQKEEADAVSEDKNE